MWPLLLLAAVVDETGHATTDHARPLDGMVVADFSRVLAGPLCTMILADLGADVIKVERPPNGDDTRAWGPPWFGEDSTYFLAANRNKRSVVLDLSDPTDRRLSGRLARRADVLVENFRPGGAAKLGLDYDSLSADNPRLIYASITGFGSQPEAAHMGGYDFLVQAVSGLMSVTGIAAGEPTKVGVAVIDVICGLYTAIGILSAHAEREHSGVGQRVHVSLLGSALASLVNQASSFLSAGVIPGAMGNAHPSIVPYETVETLDRPLALAVGSDRLFAGLVDALGLWALRDDPRFMTNSARVQHRGELMGELEKVFRQRPAAAWVADLRARGIPAGVVNNIEEAFSEAVSLGLDPVAWTHRADGTRIPTVRSPIELSRTPTDARAAPPLLGEHDAEIRRWIGE